MNKTFMRTKQEVDGMGSKGVKMLQRLMLVFMIFCFGFSEMKAQIPITVDGNPIEWNAANFNLFTYKQYTQDAFGNGVVDNQFTEGSKDFFPANQLVWSISQTKAKNDLANGAAVIKDNILYFAGDRTSNNGDAQIGFWLYLGGTGPVTINGQNTFSPPHVDGDILVLVNFTNGGRLGTVAIYQWDAAGNGNVPNTNGNLRTTNLVGYAAQNNDIMYNVPTGWNFISPQYDVNEFFEGEVNLGSLNLPSLCNASFLLETRSSQSVTASLDDFVAGSFNITPASPSVMNPSNCGPWTGDLASLVTCSSPESMLRIYTAAEGGMPLSNTQVTVNSTTTYYASCYRTIGNNNICESARVPFTITIKSASSSTQSRTICSNELPYSWDGLTFNAAGQQVKTGLTNAAGCDSTATYNLTVNPTTSSTQNRTICSNELPYSWDGLTFTAAGQQVKTGLTNAAGCDSTATYNLTVNPTTSSTQNRTICSNELPYSWDGLTFTAADTKVKTGLSNQYGCDSTATYVLNVNPTTSSRQERTICSNELPYSWDGLTFTAADTKVKTGLSNQYGCDSTATYVLTVNPIPTCSISGPFAQAGAPVTNVCVGGGQPAPIVFYNAPEGDYTYEWAVTEIGGAAFEAGSEQLIITNGQGTRSVAVQVIGSGWLKLKITDNTTGCYSECYVPVITRANGACTIQGPDKACVNQEVNYSAAAVDGATYMWSIEGNASFVGSTSGNTVTVKAGAVGSYKVLLVITKPGDCPSYCDWTTKVELCGTPYCTYTQGYYGNTGGIACTPAGPRTTTALISSALASMPGGQLYLGTAGRSFTATTASYIIGIMPGGGNATMLPAGNAVNSTTASFLRRGKITNVLLSQTIALALNAYMPGSNLRNFSLADGGGTADKWLITVAKKGGCDIVNATPAECTFAPVYSTCSDGVTRYISGYTTTYNPYKSWRISSKVINALPGNKTILDLLNLASAALGGAALPAGVSYSDIAGAAAAINEAFDECRLFVTFASSGNVSGFCTAPASGTCPPTIESASFESSLSINAGDLQNPASVMSVKELTMNTYPNPFRGQLNFRFVSPVSGRARLEVFNMHGQRLGIVFDGNVSAGIQNFARFSATTPVSGMLIYKLTVGDKSVTGKVQSIR